MEEVTDMLMPVITTGVQCVEELSQLIIPPLAPSPVDSNQSKIKPYVKQIQRRFVCISYSPCGDFKNS